MERKNFFCFFFAFSDKNDEVKTVSAIAGIFGVFIYSKIMKQQTEINSLLFGLRHGNILNRDLFVFLNVVRHCNPQYFSELNILNFIRGRSVQIICIVGDLFV